MQKMIAIEEIDIVQEEITEDLTLIGIMEEVIVIDVLGDIIELGQFTETIDIATFMVLKEIIAMIIGEEGWLEVLDTSFYISIKFFEVFNNVVH